MGVKTPIHYKSIFVIERLPSRQPFFTSLTNSADTGQDRLMKEKYPK